VIGSGVNDVVEIYALTSTLRVVGEKTHPVETRYVSTYSKGVGDRRSLRVVGFCSLAAEFKHQEGLLTLEAVHV
jgi:hypothetical protein